MEKVETPLDVLSRAATMVQPCPAYPASDSEGFETPSTVSSCGDSEGDRALSPDAPLVQAKELTGKWRRERRPIRLPEYRPRESGRSSSLRSQSFRENRSIAGLHARAPHSDGDLSDEIEDRPANLIVNTKEMPTSQNLAEPKELTGKWRRDRRSVRLPDYSPRESGKMALRSQSFKEHRSLSSVYARAMPHSDGELSDEIEDAPANLSVNATVAPPEYNCIKNEAPIDMRLRTRPAPPPYTRPSVITRGADKPTGSLSMCDPVIDEHFRRSLGDDYMKLYKKGQEPAQPTPKPNMKDRASSPIEFNMAEPAPKQSKIIAMEVDDANLSVDDHFAKALGETWKQIQSSRLKPNDSDKKVQSCSEEVVDDHFSKALGDTWKKIRKSPDEKTKEQSTKIISRSGVVI